MEVCSTFHGDHGNPKEISDRPPPLPEPTGFRATKKVRHREEDSTTVQDYRSRLLAGSEIPVTLEELCKGRTQLSSSPIMYVPNPTVSGLPLNFYPTEVISWEGDDRSKSMDVVSPDIYGPWMIVEKKRKQQGRARSEDGGRGLRLDLALTSKVRKEDKTVPSSSTSNVDTNSRVEVNSRLKGWDNQGSMSKQLKETMEVSEHSNEGEGVCKERMEPTVGRQDMQHEFSVHGCLCFGASSSDWRLAFPEASVNHLARYQSDHRPLLLKLCSSPPPIQWRPFRFIRSWMSHAQYNEFASSS
ncbi:hypothetical protein SASPL_105066 [Salvia splendens]|uniref:Uncharacterized protein n=1 Tax=Salvia splendens TaxID=180675 RepID=A0A8X9A8Z8_SALSN|nr:hypothetical protein SASPL_105066 [Salvia splendens]